MKKYLFLVTHTILLENKDTVNGKLNEDDMWTVILLILIKYYPRHLLKKAKKEWLFLKYTLLF